MMGNSMVVFHHCDSIDVSQISGQDVTLRLTITNKIPLVLHTTGPLHVSHTYNKHYVL